MYKILSIDGGGIRGIIPASILTTLEEKKEKPIAEMFDLLVGTSTGGLLTAALSVPDSTGGRPKYSARQLLTLYQQRGREIFDKALLQQMPFIGFVSDLFDETYSHEPLERLLTEYFADSTLSGAITPLVITSYDIERRETYFFKTSQAKSDVDRDHFLRDVVRATTAAPTYFEPAMVRSRAKTPTERALVDGGVFASNPAMCGYIEAITSAKAKRSEIIMVSLGTGIATRTIKHEEAKNWGTIGWVRQILSVMMDGSADAIDYHLGRLLPSTKGNKNQRYFRFDDELDIGYDDLDNTDHTNLFALMYKAEQILDKQSSELDRLLPLL